jgi:uncharacterized sodium:solute symporter family permease YidK
MDHHFLHYMAFFFVCISGLALLLGHFFPHDKPPLPDIGTEGIDTTPWKHFKWVSVLAVIAMIATYIVFSPLGVADSKSGKDINWTFLIIGVVMTFVVFGIPLIRKSRENQSG